MNNEMTAFLNAQNESDTTTMEETNVENTPKTKEELKSKLDALKKNQIIDLFLQLAEKEEDQFHKLDVIIKKLDAITKNYTKLLAAYTALKGKKPIVKTAQQTKDALAVLLSGLPILGFRDICPTCKTTVKRNCRDNCITCCNRTIQEFYAARYQK